MSRITDTIGRIAADGRVTPSEWKDELAGQVEALPKRESDDARAVLKFFANGELEMDEDTHKAIRNSLLPMGYDTMDPRPKDLSTEAYFNFLSRTNITETDRELERLLGAAGKASAETTVAVLDLGFDEQHPALQGKLWTNPGEIAGDGLDNDGNGRVDDVHGWNFRDGNNVLKSNPHGTHVVGLATSGSTRIKAIAEASAGTGGEAVVQGIEDAAAHGARVINMSFSATDKGITDLELAAIKAHPEILFVKSAGNDGKDLSTYDPAEYLSSQQLPNMAVVAASNADGTRRPGSNFGAPFATHAALGTQIYSSIDDQQYEWFGGTSMATPTVANAAAKLLLLDDKLTPEQLKGILNDTSDVSDQWRGVTSSSGLINQDRGMRLAALTGLMRTGVAADAAADQIGLTGDERVSLIGLAGRYT